MAPIRFAILADHPRLEPWQARCLARLQALEYVIPVVRIVVFTAPADQPGAGDGTSNDVSGVPLLQLQASTDWAVEAAARLGSLEVDFILTWCSQPCPAGLLTTARWGAWRYQFGDWQTFRGAAPGFWEVYAGCSVSTAMLVQVQPDPDCIVVLREGCLRTNLRSWRRNLEQLQSCCTEWAAQLCVDIRNGELEQFGRPAIRSQARVRSRPTLVQSVVQELRGYARRIGSALQSLFRHEQWNIAVVDQPIAAFLDPSSRAPTRWIASPKSWEFLADSFGVLRDGRLTVLCEYLSYRDNRGIIVAIDPTGALRPVDIGPRPVVHLSYPCLLELDGRLLCIPETHEAREIALYESERFPDRWRKVATLVANTVAVDATPFRHGERWWLAASTPAARGANCELNLWHAPDITGPWEPHMGNPVKIDVRSARPAGVPFMHAGELYRPAQDCSETYGRRVVINRIVKLTLTDFREEFAAAVDPDPAGPFPAGLHTLSAVGDVTLIDGKRMRFVPAQFWRSLRRGWAGTGV